MKKAIAIVKLAVLAAVFAVTLVSVQAPTAEASYYCISGNSRCEFGPGQPLIYQRIWIP